MQGRIRMFKSPVSRGFQRTAFNTRAVLSFIAPGLLLSSLLVHLDDLQSLSQRGSKVGGADGRQEDEEEQNTVVTHEASVYPEVGSGISRCDASVYSRNTTSGDLYTFATLPLPLGFWSIFVLLDGPSRSPANVWLHDNIVIALAGALADLYSRFQPAPGPSQDSINETIRETYVRLSEDLVPTSIPRALVGFLDSDKRMLHVARTGAACAVLGRRSQVSSGAGPAIYEALALDSDSLATSFPEDVTLSTSVSPEVVNFEVHEGDFLVMATEHTWKRLTPQNAVELIAQWKEHGKGYTVEIKDIEKQWAEMRRPHNLDKDANAATQLLSYVHDTDDSLTTDILAEVAVIVVFFQ
ncbi:hypothetical protein BV25DRAFT_1916449 [Artomyces pyxidatus]|uniref:Uncharacterized protein n=1 Tax=Artomyces pyxidatus TaxID=48021 RepID=A0ACB8T0E4_9AGAM|nr:hypothetical protein BV25DRAFT_1916449 [Artomyces pyxidatus]